MNAVQWPEENASLDPPGSLESRTAITPGAHYVRAADDAAGGGLVQDDAQPEWVVAVQDLLAGHPQLDPPVNIGSGVAGAPGADDGAGIVGGLEQAVDELGLVGADLGGFGFQADEVGVLAGQDVGVGLPPAPLLGLAGQLEQRLAVGLAGDLVQVEQAADVTDDDAALQALDPGQLGRVPFQRRPGRRHRRHRPRPVGRPGLAPGLHLRVDPAARHHPEATAATMAAVLRAAALPWPRRQPSAAGAARLAAFLDRRPGWSAFWDKRYGLWRAAEDDPSSVLYAENPDADAVISYITGCS